MSADPAVPAPHRHLFAALLATLAWLPVPYGATVYWAWRLLSIVSLLLLAVWALSPSRATGRPPVALRKSLPILTLLAGFLLLALIQAVPLPRAVAGLLSPASVAFQELATERPDPGWVTLSLDPGATLADLLKSAGYVAVFVLTLALATTARRLRLVAYLLVAVAAAESLWGIAVVLTPDSGVTRAAGTFGNANLFAGLLEVGIPFALGMMIASHPGHARHAGVRARGAALLDWLLSWKVVALYGALFAMLAALVASGSRGGALSLLAALATAAGLMSALRPAGFGSRALAALLALLLALGLALLAGESQLVARLVDNTLDLDRSGRLPYAQASLEMAGDFPAVGIGAGGWHHLYPLYRPPGIDSYNYPLHAHNDHLQLLAERGAIGYALLGGAILLALFPIVAGLAWRRDPTARGVLFASLASSLSLLFHALGDNNFQVPSTTAYFFVALALGLVAARLE